MELSKSFINFKSAILWILLIVFFCYANSLTNDYNMDDEIVTVNHPLTSKGISAISEILKSPYFQSDIYSYEYRPIVHISFAIEHQFLGQSAFVSHLINLLLYLLLIYVVFELFKLLFPEVNHIILAAIVFLWALHPTHTEVVSSIKNRDEILALLFSFLAWKQALKFSTTNEWWRILLVLLLFNLAMGSKVTVIPMVFIIPLSIWFLLGTINLRVILISLLLSISGVIWFQQLDILRMVIFVALNIVVFIVGIIVFNFQYLIALVKIKELEKDEHHVSNSLEFDNLFFLFKNNITLIIALLLLNVIIVINSINLLSMMGLVLAPLLIAYFAKPSSRVFWLIFSVLFAGEFALIFSDSIIVYNAVLYVVILVAYITTKKLIDNRCSLLLIVFAIVIGIVSKSYVSLLLLLNFSFYLKFHFRWFALLLSSILVISSVTSYSGVFGVDRALLITDFLFLNILNFIIYPSPKLQKYSLVALVIYFAAACLILEFSGFKDYKSKSPIIISKNIANVSNLKLSVVPTQTYRPVLFAEFPVDLVKDNLRTKIGTSAEVLFKYLKLTLIPYPLSFYYGYSEIKPVSVNNAVPIISILIHILLLIAIALSFKRNKLIAFGISLYLISIAPFSAFVSPIPGVMADRYLFSPTLGFATILIGLIIWLFKIDWHSKLSGTALFPKNARYILSAVLLVYASLTIARNNDWKDRLTLFRNDIVHVPNSAQAHNLLAYHLNRKAQEVTDPLERKKFMEEAAFHFQRATEIWPEFMNATYDLGRTHEQLGNWNKAIVAYRRTFEIDTSFSDAIFRMGIVYDAENKFDSAIIVYEFVTKDNPMNITAFNNLSYCYFKIQAYRSAIETGKRCSKFHPTNTDPIVNIGKTFLHIKENDSALYYFEKVYPNRSEDKGLTEVLYKLWNEKGNIERASFYYRRMQIMGMVK